MWGPTHKAGHKAPIWNWDVDFYIGGEQITPQIQDAFKISVLEEDVIGSDDKVGESQAVLI